MLNDDETEYVDSKGELYIAQFTNGGCHYKNVNCAFLMDNENCSKAFCNPQERKDQSYVIWK